MCFYHIYSTHSDSLFTSLKVFMTIWHAFCLENLNKAWLMKAISFYYLHRVFNVMFLNLCCFNSIPFLLLFSVVFDYQQISLWFNFEKLSVCEYVSFLHLFGLFTLVAILWAVSDVYSDRCKRDKICTSEMKLYVDCSKWTSQAYKIIYFSRTVWVEGTEGVEVSSRGNGFG